MKKLTIALLLSSPVLCRADAGIATQKAANLQNQQASLSRDLKTIQKGLTALLIEAGQEGELQGAKQTLQQQYNSFHSQYQQFLNTAYRNYSGSYKNLDSSHPKLTVILKAKHEKIEKEKESVDSALKEIKGLYADMLAAENSLKQQTKGKAAQKEIQRVSSRLQGLSALLKMPELAPQESKTLVSDYMALFRMEKRAPTPMELQRDVKHLQQALKKTRKLNKFEGDIGSVEKLINQGDIGAAEAQLNRVYSQAGVSRPGVSLSPSAALPAVSAPGKTPNAMQGVPKETQRAMNRADKADIPLPEGVAQKPAKGTAEPIGAGVGNVLQGKSRSSEEGQVKKPAAAGPLGAGMSNQTGPKTWSGDKRKQTIIFYGPKNKQGGCPADADDPRKNEVLGNCVGGKCAIDPKAEGRPVYKIEGKGAIKSLGPILGCFLTKREM